MWASPACACAPALALVQACMHARARHVLLRGVDAMGPPAPEGAGGLAAAGQSDNGGKCPLPPPARSSTPLDFRGTHCLAHLSTTYCLLPPPCPGRLTHAPVPRPLHCTRLPAPQDQVTAAIGMAGSPSPTLVLSMIFSLLLVNGVTYSFLIHVIYRVILGARGYRMGPLPGFLRKFLYPGGAVPGGAAAMA